MAAGITLLECDAGDVPVPAAGKITLILDAATDLPSYKDAAGDVHSLKGETGDAGPPAEPETVVDLGSGTTFNIDFAAGGTFLLAPSGNFTLTESNAPANGTSRRVVLEISNGAGKTATLPSGGSWGGAGAPTFSSGVDLVTYYRRAHASTPTKRFMFSSEG